MATVPIRVPGVGESISEGILARWLKSGEPLFELETDKASNVVAATVDGVLRITVAEGATVEIGSTVGEIDAGAVPTTAAPAAHVPTPAAAAPTPAVAGPAAADTGTPVAPAARRLASETGVDLATVPASGRGGLVTKEDVARFSDTGGIATAGLPSSPAVRRETRQRMTGIRQKIAARLVEAQHTAAILTTFNEVDMSRVMDLRARYKESFQKKNGVGLGFMSFFVKAAVEALQAFPAVNGRIEGTEIVLNHFYDIGVAVSTERGLMVPVLRDADLLNYAEIEKGIGDFAKKARENSISVSDLQGGTFTITNGGVFGSLLSTPILNPPQSAILGMHTIQKRAVVVDDQIVIRPMMYLALSYDHRIIDGREAVSFLVRIKDCLENPERILLNI